MTNSMRTLLTYEGGPMVSYAMRQQSIGRMIANNDADANSTTAARSSDMGFVMTLAILIIMVSALCVCVCCG